MSDMYCVLDVSSQIEICKDCKRNIKRVPKDKIVNLTVFTPKVLTNSCKGFK